MRNGTAEFHRRACRQHDVSHTELGTVTERGGFEAGGVDFDQGHVGQRISADDLGGVIFRVAVHIDGYLDLFRIGDDVVVRHDVAVSRDDDAGTDAALLMLLILRRRLLWALWLAATTRIGDLLLIAFIPKVFGCAEETVKERAKLRRDLIHLGRLDRRGGVDRDDAGEDFFHHGGVAHLKLAVVRQRAGVLGKLGLKIGRVDLGWRGFSEGWMPSWGQHAGAGECGADARASVHWSVWVGFFGMQHDGREHAIQTSQHREC